MGFFKSLKGDAKSGTDDLGTYQSSDANNTYNSGTHDDLSTKGERRRIFGNNSSRNPLSNASSHPRSSEPEFTPPPGPPPSRKQAELYSPPAGPPPTLASNDQPPPYHDWTSVPDTSLLPPPPAAPQDFSPANNASDESAEAAAQWCARFPPYPPNNPQAHAKAYSAAQTGDLALQRPETFAKSAELTKLTTGTWTIKTRKAQRDSIVFTDIPLYFALADNPLLTEREKVIYFELRLLSIRDAESIAAIGYAAKPYPPWRLPGWNRASIGVHGDDGRRFMNDSFGGQDFVRPFGVGDVVGLGMRMSVEESARGRGRCKTKVFFTRNGREEGSWEVDEERDAERDEGVEGLQGELDLYPSVGIAGGVEVEVRFRREDWLYKMT